MNKYFGKDDNIYRPSIRHDWSKNAPIKPMAVDSQSDVELDEPRWYRICHRIAGIVILFLAIAAAIALINLVGPVERPAQPSYLPAQK